MDAAIAGLEMNRFGGIILRRGLLKHRLKGDAEALIEDNKSATEFFYDRCHKKLLYQSPRFTAN